MIGIFQSTIWITAHIVNIALSPRNLFIRLKNVDKANGLPHHHMSESGEVAVPHPVKFNPEYKPYSEMI